MLRLTITRAGRRLLIGATTLIVGIGLFVGAFLVGSTMTQTVQPRPAASQPVAEVVSGGVSATDRTIGVLQERLRQNPNELRSQTALAFGYLQKAREIGEPGYYTRAEGLLRQAYADAPNDADTLIGLGTLALARHDFAEGLEWGRQAVAANPDRAATYGVVSDALIELGRYEEAVRAIQRMVDLQPGQAAYARVSYARELHGDLAGAIDAMRLAVDAGAAGTEGTEWTRVQLGHLYFSSGQLERAESEYRGALALYPSYIHALGGLARVAAGRGDYDLAIDLYAEATQTNPLPELVIQLAEVYRAARRLDEARHMEELIRFQQRLYAASGVDTDLEMALFDADQGVDVDGAAARAEAQWARRRSVHVADVLGWALYKRGNCRAADAYARCFLRVHAA